MTDTLELLGKLSYRDFGQHLAERHPWTAPFWHGASIIAALHLDAAGGFESTEIRDIDRMTPPGLLALGSGGWDGQGRLHHIFFDLDVGHGRDSDSYPTTAAAIEAATKLADALGDGAEIRRSKSGKGVHVCALLPDPDDPAGTNPLKKADGPKLARYIARRLGVHCDKTAEGRQCRWLWERHPQPSGFEPIREFTGKRPLDLPDIILEALAQSPEDESRHAAPARPYVAGESDDSVEHAAVKDWKPAGAFEGRSRLGERNRDDMRHFVSDWGLSIETVLRILTQIGCNPHPEVKQWERMARYQTFKRGWKAEPWHVPAFRFMQWDGTEYKPEPEPGPADDRAYAEKRDQELLDAAPKPLTIEHAADHLDEHLPPLPPDIWEGLARRGGKLTLAAPSKAGKTWALLGLATSFAAGKPYWGRLTQRQPILYVNLELTPASIYNRLQRVREALAIQKDEIAGFDVINLRGHVEGLQTLGPRIIEAARDRYGVIVLDPVYKLLGGRDENAAGQMAELCNALERIATEANALLVMAHHFPKGSASTKEAGDRLSGSGVFTRDPDSLITLTPHQQDDCYTVSAVLRDHAPLPEFVVRFQYPILTVTELDPTKLKQPKTTGNTATTKDVKVVMARGEEYPQAQIFAALKEHCGVGRDKAWAALQQAIREEVVTVTLQPRPGTHPEKLYRVAGDDPL